MGSYARIHPCFDAPVTLQSSHPPRFACIKDADHQESMRMKLNSENADSSQADQQEGFLNMDIQYKFLPSESKRAQAVARTRRISITWINDTGVDLEDCEAIVSDDDGTSGVVVETAYFGTMRAKTSATKYVYLPSGYEKAATRFSYDGEVYPNFGFGDNLEVLTVTVGDD